MQGVFPHDLHAGGVEGWITNPWSLDSVCVVVINYILVQSGRGIPRLQESIKINSWDYCTCARRATTDMALLTGDKSAFTKNHDFHLFLRNVHSLRPP